MWRPVPSFTAMLFECGEAALLEPWQLDVSRLGGSGSQAARARRRETKAGRQEKAAARAKKQLLSCRGRKRC